MRLLTLIRHAKSSWDDGGLRDFDRPLNARGLRDAPVMAARLHNAMSAPDRLISSPALRALSTAQTFARTLRLSEDAIVLAPGIYDASGDTLLTLVRELDDVSPHVALFGHNPGLSQLAGWLSVEPLDELPTCGIVQLAFDIGRWQDLAEASGTLRYHDWPKKPLAQ